MVRAWLDRYAEVLVTLIAVGVASTTLVVFARSISGAPVPPGPRELTTEMVVGRWDLEWGPTPGTMWFHSDGSFVQRLDSRANGVWHGTWIVAGAEILLDEWLTDFEWWHTSGPVAYRYRLDLARYPYLAGAANGYTKIVLKNPKRE